MSVLSEERFDIEEVIRILGIEIRAEQADEGRDFDVACRIILNKLEKCKKYEELEEQGLLLRLPCKVGDTIYYLMDIDDEVVVAERKICTLTNVVAMIEDGSFGKNVFLTQGEAAVKLR